MVAELQARVEDLVTSRETLLSRVAEWQHQARNGDADAIDLAEFIAALSHDILALEHRSVSAEKREAELREQLLQASRQDDTDPSTTDAAASDATASDTAATPDAAATEPEDADKAPGDGRFVLLPGSPNSVIVVADPLGRATAKSASWVATTGFGAEKVRDMEVALAGGGKWRIERARDDAHWKLTPLFAGETLDALRANSASYSLNRIAIADVAAPAVRAEETGLDRPTTVVASTFDGLTYTLKLGKARGDDFYATLWVSGEAKSTGADAGERTNSLAERLPREKALAGHILLIPRSKFEDVLRKRAELLEKKDPAKK
jgi:hypothetical protein